MVNEAILGALQSSLARGESLKKAMMTLYNAGYKKEEISEAAKSINQAGIQPAPPIQKIKPTKKSLKKPKKQKQPTQLPQLAQQQIPQQPIQQPQQQVPPQQPTPQQKMQQQFLGQTPQRVSQYGQPPKPIGKAIIIVLGFLLLVLVGILVTIFLFKEELINFFNDLFS